MYNTKDEQQVAADIYNYLHKTYYGTTQKEINFRLNYGSNGVVDKVLNYIYNKYLREPFSEIERK